MTMRLFIALDLPDALKAELEKSASLLREACTRASFAPRDNYHITLAFLGGVPSEQMEDITLAMGSSVCRPIPLTIGGLGRFRRDGGDVFWRAVRAEDTLAHLRLSLTEALAAKGIAADEENAFRPHLTLARQAVLREDVLFADLCTKMPDLHFTAAHMTLFHSQRISGKLIYTPLSLAHFPA